MFETTGGDALAAWARGAPAPRGASWAAEIYRRLPNDTDFSIYKTLGATGLNVAAVADAYGYHTDRDRPARVTDAVIRHEGVNTVGVVRALDVTALRPDGPLPSYFDIAGRWAFLVPGGVDRAITDFGLVAGGTAWLSVLAWLWRRDRPARLIITALWWALAAAAAGGAALAVVPVLRWARAEQQPWYAHPLPFVALIAALMTIGVATVMVIATRVPSRARAAFSPASAWAVALPVWIVLAIGASRTAPQTAFLLTLPLLAVSIPLALPVSGSGKSIAAGVLGLVAIALLWWPGWVLLLRFVVTLFGWLPLVTPVWAVCRAGHRDRRHHRTAGPGARPGVAGRRARRSAARNRRRNGRRHRDRVGRRRACESGVHGGSAGAAEREIPAGSGERPGVVGNRSERAWRRPCRRRPAGISLAADVGALASHDADPAVARAIPDDRRDAATHRGASGDRAGARLNCRRGSAAVDDGDHAARQCSPCA